MFDERNFARRAPSRRQLRFGERVVSDALDASGKLTAAWVRPATGEAWLELTTRDFLRRASAHILAPAGASETPPPDAARLRAGQRALCHEGFVGRVSGVMFDTASGVVDELIVRVRSDLQTNVRRPQGAFGALGRLGGQDALLAAKWITVANGKHAATPAGDDDDLRLDATAEQIASAAVLRPDGAISADISQTLERNPAIGPLLGRIEIVVHDGAVVLRGAVPSARHRASAEQDIWHVAGVVSVTNELRIRPA